MKTKKHTRSEVSKLLWYTASSDGEGNGSPLQGSCLENPRDGGAWWAAGLWGRTVGHDWSDLAAGSKMMISKIPQYMHIYLFIN